MVFDLILANAWKNGDPGLIFIDEINKHNVVKHLGDIATTGMNSLFWLRKSQPRRDQSIK